MSGSAKNDRVIRFSVFELDRDSGELFKQGRKIKLQGQPFELLVALLDRPGEVLSREELRQKVWPTDTAGDFDHGLNRAVNKVREALGDSPETPRFIETLPRRGYRFIAPIEKEPPRVPSTVDVRAAARLPPDAPPTPPPAPDASARKPRSARHRFAWVGTAAAVMLVAGAGVLYYRHFEQAPTASDNLPPPVPLTSYPGFQWSPAFSPEGTRVAFTWEEPGKHPPSIYIKFIGPSDPVRLSSGESSDFGPAWSPDGRWIVFLRAKDRSSCAVMLIPSLGGPARELARLRVDMLRFIHYGYWTVTPPFLAWSSDSKWLLALEQSGPETSPQGAPMGIVRISVESGEKTPFPLSLEADQNRSGQRPPSMSDQQGLAVSPDGRVLAFIHTPDPLNTGIYVVKLSGEMMPAGPATSLHFGRSSCTGIAWDTDGRSLIVSSNRRGPYELWRVPVNRSQPSRIAVSDERPSDLAVSKPGQHLAYTHSSSYDWNIWRVDLKSAQLKDAVAFIASTKDEFNPSYSPDGRRIAFESDRSGNEEIWVAEEDGSHVIQLTSFTKAYSGTPRWSPDGRQIAFDSDAAGQWNIYVVSSQHGGPARLTTGSGSQIRPSWSHDGKWIYYCAFGNNGIQIWKQPATGGAEIQVTKNGGCNQIESLDGEYVYYLNKGNSALWRVPSAGGQEVQLAELGWEAPFAVAKHGVYFTDSPHASVLKFLDYRSASIKVLGTLPGPIITGLTLSPDEHWLLYGKSESAGSQLMIVEKFR